MGLNSFIIYDHISDKHLENLVNLLQETNLVTDLVAKKSFKNQKRDKLFRRKEWTMQDLNLRLLLSRYYQSKKKHGK